MNVPKLVLGSIGICIGGVGLAVLVAYKVAADIARHNGWT